MSIVKFKGVKVFFGGEDLVFAPLNLNALEQLSDSLTDYKGGASKGDMMVVANVALASLKRNYPDYTMEQVKEYLDIGNMKEVMEATMDVSGMIRKKQEMGELVPSQT